MMKVQWELLCDPVAQLGLHDEREAATELITGTHILWSALVSTMGCHISSV